MMQCGLTLTSFLERAGKLYPRVEVVSRLPDNSIRRSTYADLCCRARALAAGLQQAGIRQGDRVATLMWNHSVHLEGISAFRRRAAWYTRSTSGCIRDELAFIANHARDRWLIVDDVLLPLHEKFADKISFERVIVVPFSGSPAPSEYEDY